MAPKIVALVAGGQAAGKKAVCQAIKEKLNVWKVNNIEQLSLESFKQDVILEGCNIEGPEVYDFDKCAAAITSSDAHVLLVEGLYLLYSQLLKKLGTVSIYVDVDDDGALTKGTVTRDTTVRNKSLEEVLDNYLEFAKPAMERYIKGTKSTADIILMRGVEPSGIELIAGSIFDRLLLDSPGSMNTGSVPWRTMTPTSARHHLLESDFGAENFYELA